MSITYLGLIAVGSLIIFGFFKKKIDLANRAIEIGTIPNSTYSKLPIVRKAEHDKSNYQIVGFLTFLCYLAVCLNFNYVFVGAWVILLAVGLSVSLSVNLLNTPLIIYEEEVDNQIIRLQRLLKAEEAKKISIFILAVTLGFSGYWANQISKNTSAEREAGIQEVLSLAGTGWCSNFQDIKVYDDGADVVKSGGWPCIQIGSVDRVSFSKEKKENKMCIWVSLNRENGPPGEERFQNSYKNFDVCASTTWYNNWSESTFSNLIFDVAKPDLDEVQVSLCRYYGYRMGVENYATYC